MSNEPKYEHLKTFAEFEKLRRANPNFYFSGKVQTRMHKMAEQMGESFYKVPTPKISSSERQERREALLKEWQELEASETESNDSGEDNANG